MRKNLRTQFNQRQYMVSRDFEIYYYSDTHMENVKSHTHDHYEVYFFLKGNVKLSIGKGNWQLQPGDIIVIPPHTHHHLDINDPESPYQRFIFWMKEDYCRYLGSLSEDYTYMMKHTARTCKYIYHPDSFTFQTVSAKVLALIEEINAQRFARDARISLCVQDLVLSLNRCIYELETTTQEPVEKNLYQSVMDYIENHLTDAITLDVLAQEFYVSKYHISHIFKENMGVSVHQYLLKKRLDAVRTAILSGTEITAACTAYGFHDYSSFYRAFRKEYGISPKEYAQKHTLQNALSHSEKNHI